MCAYKRGRIRMWKVEQEWPGILSVYVYMYCQLINCTVFAASIT